ncbi:MAG TPA: M14 family metallopeptidase [Lachnospiraceae bacterium]|nr:M14 family metallopeptidase [Lachnospiraceae bacterium]
MTSEIQTSEFQTSEIQTSEIQTSEIQTSEIQTSEIQTIVSVNLPADEKLNIKKHRLSSGEGRRISIVTGIHGDELEGQFVVYELSRRIAEHPEFLHGTVDLYPAVNTMGIDSITRGIPAFDLDMNRIFPGRYDGDMNEFLASQIIDNLKGSDLCIDIHASNIYLTEIPQIRINEITRDELLPLAILANVDFVWIHGASTVLESTLAYSLNHIGTKTLVVEMGVGMRITSEYGLQLTEGILNLMRVLGIWSGPVNEIRTPVISQAPDDVIFLNAPVSGIFMKSVRHGSHLKKGEKIGSIINPMKGSVLQEVLSPADGWLFTIREYPVVSEGSLMARILRENSKNDPRKG